MLIYILIILVIIIALIWHYYRQRHLKVVFTGPRSSGKTYTLTHLTQKKSHKTVPTLETYSTTYIDGRTKLTITDFVPVKGKTFNEIYGINDKETRYFFFFNDVIDLVDYESGFDVYFVYRGNRADVKKMGGKLMERLIVLDEDVEKLRKYLVV